MAITTKNLTCIVCPRGCTLTVTLDSEAENPVVSVEGQGCKRGVEYATAECTHPTRVLTTTAPTVDGGVVPCKTDRPIPRELLFEAIKEVNALSVPAVVKIGDVLLEDLLGTGANIVATANRG
ncbi:MAG: DUF1667 domain-containing protein [Clostridia bacterium]|nr:DUF1667 domain-containing protein [Clostridia bacterium]